MARRTDAVRNRERLVEEAARAFAAEGPDASLEGIARRTGLAVGTLYRHFPTREHLQEAVFCERIDTLRSEAEIALGAPDPYRALVGWLSSYLAHARAWRNLGTAVLMTKLWQGSAANLRCRELVTAGDALLQRAKDAGDVRSDITISELLHLVHGITVTLEKAPPHFADPVRMLSLVLDGVHSCE